MAGDWIKMRFGLQDDPAVIGIAAMTGLDEYAVVGRLHKLWSWADQQSRDGHAPNVTEVWVDRHVGRDGFALAMAKEGWLLIGKDGVSIPNFDRHNGKSAKKRALAADRKATQRSGQKSRSEGDKNVTREEKRRINNPPTPFVPPEWVPIETWNSFEAMRKGLKNAKFGDQAKRLIVTELDKLRKAGHSVRAVLEQSIRNEWKDVYAPKHTEGGRKAIEDAFRGVV